MTRFWMGLGTGFNEKLNEFKKSFPEGNLIFKSFEVGAKPELAFRESARDKWAKVNPGMGEKFEPGGDLVDFLGKTYSGPLGPQPLSGATFYGSVIGTATGAINAWTAVTATAAASASSLGAGGFGLPPVPPSPVPLPPSAPPPNSAIVGLHLAGGSYAIRSVTIDGGGTLKSKILDLDGYGGVFENGEPTTEEIRQAVRDPANKDVLGGQAAIDGIINTEFDVGTPPAIGRTAGVGRTTTFGTTPLGNSEKGLGKQFTVTKLEESVDKEIQNAIVDSGILGDSDGA